MAHGAKVPQVGLDWVHVLQVDLDGVDVLKEVAHGVQAPQVGLDGVSPEGIGGLEVLHGLLVTAVLGYPLRAFTT